MADLVTLADPTSPYSFLNYLKESGRLYPFYIRESFFPLRPEYNDYCRWAAAKLPSVRFGHRVTSVEYDAADDRYVVHAVATPANGSPTGPGTWCWAPAPRRTSRTPVSGLGGDVIHNSALPASTGRRCAPSAASPSSAAGRAPPRSTTTCSPTSAATATSSTG